MTKQLEHFDNHNRKRKTSEGRISIGMAVEKEEYELASEEYEKTLLALLKSRMLLRKIIEQKMYEERMKKGNLNAKEITDLLRNQNEEDDEDFILKISELRRQLLNEIRKNATEFCFRK